MPEYHQTTSGCGYPLTMRRLNHQGLEQMKQIENKIPTKKTGRVIRMIWMHDSLISFFGKNIVEVQPLFQMNVIERAWELRVLPVKAFSVLCFCLA